MRHTAILLAGLLLTGAVAQAQTRADMQDKLIQFLTTDLRLSPDQQSKARQFLKESDSEMAKYEQQYFGKPEMVAKMRKQVTMEFGQKVGSILTSSQLSQYPKTKQKLYTFLQDRYENEMREKQGSEAQTREMQEAKPREPK